MRRANRKDLAKIKAIREARLASIG